MNAFNDWSLISGSLLPAAVLWTAVILSLALIMAAWRGYRGSKYVIRLTLLRSIALGMALFILFQPTLRLRKIASVASDIAVIVDDSASMALRDEAGTRNAHAQKARSQLQKDIEQETQRFRFRPRNLHAELSAHANSEEPSAQESPIVVAIEQTIEALGSNHLAGIVVISDGADTDLQGHTPAQLETKIKSLAAHKIPINVVPIGSSAFQDDSIESITAGDFAFVQNTFPMRAAIRSTGFPKGPITVTLRKGNTPIANAQATPGADGSAEVTFSVKAETLGESIYTLEISRREGDAIPENNQQHHIVRVLRDKIRVLHVAGRPSWDERFLRQYFQENPNVDVISFFILRTNSDNTGPQEDLSLIPFPVNELFTSKLSSFDVIVFQNFDFRPYRMEQYLDNIRQAVENGLGFVMIGGDQSFTDGGYRGTPIVDILPVELGENAHYVLGDIHPVLGPSAQNHPIAMPSDLATLPPWTGHNTIINSNIHGSVLLQTSQGEPLIVTGEPKKGRSLAIATDSLWRWRFRRPAEAAEMSYRRFWHDAMQWLVKDPAHAHLRIHVPVNRVQQGDPVDVEVSVFNTSYKPEIDAPVTMRLETAEGEQIQEHSQRTGKDGILRMPFNGVPAGVYVIKASRQGSTDVAEAAVIITNTNREHQAAAPRPDILKAIAEATGGAILTISDAQLSSLKLRDPKLVDVEKEKMISLWDTWPVLVLFFAALVAEWLMRRRLGYS